jgi:large subunit ribosomal protein L9
MKVILNEDVKHLGELGDVKNVANGYARNYLFPHMYAVPYSNETVAYFESRKAEIEARKEAKRADSASLKDKLEALEVVITMPAGNNGKLYGAVTSQTIADFYKKNGFDIERKRIEVPGVTIKNTGNYHFNVHLYESTVAEVKLAVKAQEGVLDEAAKKAADDAAKAEKAKKEARAAARAAEKEAPAADAADAPAAEKPAEETK